MRICTLHSYVTIEEVYILHVDPYKKSILEVK